MYTEKVYIQVYQVTSGNILLSCCFLFKDKIQRKGGTDRQNYTLYYIASLVEYTAKHGCFLHKRKNCWSYQSSSLHKNLRDQASYSYWTKKRFLACNFNKLVSETIKNRLITVQIK